MPTLLRGDIAHGNEEMLAGAEQRGLAEAGQEWEGVQWSVVFLAFLAFLGLCFVQVVDSAGRACFRIPLSPPLIS